MRTVSALVLTVAGLPALTALLIGDRDQLALGSMLLLYLLAVVVVSAVGGLVPGLLAALTSFVLANWFLTPPFHTLAVEGRDSLVELVAFATAAAVVAATVERLAARDRLRYQHALDVEVARTRAKLTAEDRARAALLAAVGHDLRTPLASTKAAVSMLRQTDVSCGARGQRRAAGHDRAVDRPPGPPRGELAGHEPPRGRCRDRVPHPRRP